MERVTDEWLKQVALAAYDSSGCESIGDDTKAMIALHRAVSQAVAREFLNLSEQELAGMLHYRKLHLDMKDFYTASQYDRGIDALQRLIADARARFGLEDEERQQAQQPSATSKNHPIRRCNSRLEGSESVCCLPWGHNGNHNALLPNSKPWW